MSASETKTQKFNVGGTVFEVSRSLLERYPESMLTRMSSDLWQGNSRDNNKNNGCSNVEAASDAQKPLFIERDAELFRFVLSYMRDGENVSIPLNRFTEKAFLDELTYYGLEYSTSLENGGIIFVPQGAAAIPYLIEIEKKFSEKESDHDFHVQCLRLAKLCCSKYRQNGNFAIGVGNDADASSIQSSKVQLEQFNCYLAWYGLKCVKIERYGNYTDFRYTVHLAMI